MLKGYQPFQEEVKKYVCIYKERDTERERERERK